MIKKFSNLVLFSILQNVKSYLTFRCLCEDDVPLSQTNKSQCGLDPLLLQAKRDGISSYDLITGESAVIKDGLSGG